MSTRTDTLFPYTTLFRSTLFGVSAFPSSFGSASIETAGDAPDVLVAMNTAALKTNVEALKFGGLVLAGEGEFSDRNLAQANYDANPPKHNRLAKGTFVNHKLPHLTHYKSKPTDSGHK